MQSYKNTCKQFFPLLDVDTILKIEEKEWMVFAVYFSLQKNRTYPYYLYGLAVGRNHD